MVGQWAASMQHQARDISSSTSTLRVHSDAAAGHSATSTDVITTPAAKTMTARRHYTRTLPPLTCIKYSLDFLRQITKAEAFEAVDWLADVTQRT